MEVSVSREGIGDTRLHIQARSCSRAAFLDHMVPLPTRQICGSVRANACAPVSTPILTGSGGVWVQAQVDREQRIKEDVSQIMKTFYCEVGACQKGADPLQRFLPSLPAAADTLTCCTD
jgi:hypothetical protein